MAGLAVSSLGGDSRFAGNKNLGQQTVNKLAERKVKEWVMSNKDIVPGVDLRDALGLEK
jgi:hypothetical protein